MPPKKESDDTKKPATAAKSAPPKSPKSKAPKQPATAAGAGKTKSTSPKATKNTTGKAVAKKAGKAGAKAAAKKASTKSASKTAAKSVAKTTVKSAAKKVAAKGDKKAVAKKTAPTAQGTAKASKKQPPKKRTLAPKTAAGAAVLKKGKKAAVKDEKKVEKKKKARSVHVEARPKKFHIGGDLKPNRNIGRMVKWPAYIRLQRRKKIMLERLKVPAQIHQFSQTLEKHSALQLFQLIKKYRPESEYQRKKRLLQLANDKKEGKTISTEKPFVIKFGASHVTTLVEQKKAKLVVIANDVDPIEHVLYLPGLCHKLDIPYVIVKNKARLGTAVHMKTCAALAFVNVKQEDKGNFTKLVTLAKENYNDKRDHILRTIGGGKLGLRSSTMLRKRKEALEKAQLARANLV